MEVIYILIPVMILIGLILVGLLIWSVKQGQYDDLEGDGNRILMDDDLHTPKEKKDPRSWPDADDSD